MRIHSNRTSSSTTNLRRMTNVQEDVFSSSIDSRSDLRRRIQESISTGFERIEDGWRSGEGRQCLSPRFLRQRVRRRQEDQHAGILDEPECWRFERGQDWNARSSRVQAGRVYLPRRGNQYLVPARRACQRSANLGPRGNQQLRYARPTSAAGATSVASTIDQS